MYFREGRCVAVQVFVKIRGRFGQNIAQPQNPTESGKFVWIKKSLNKNDRDPGARKSQLCHAERLKHLCDYRRDASVAGNRSFRAT
jgi:hypothetical protein